MEEDHVGEIMEASEADRTTSVRYSAPEPEPESELNLREDDGETSEDSDERESDREDEYNFQFDVVMDPLLFAEKEDTSVEPLYQSFHRIMELHRQLATTRPASDNDESEMSAKRSRLEKENIGKSIKEIDEVRRRRRRKGSKNKASPEVTRKLADATLHYAKNEFDEAIEVLKEVIRLAPNLSDPYHTLGLINYELGDMERSMNFNMIAAHLAPKDASLWKLLLARSVERGDNNQALYCLKKAIIADPEDTDLQLHRASLYVERGEYQKAADCYQRISRLCPDNIEVLQKATQLYLKCKQRERAVSMLEETLRHHMDVAHFCVVDILASVLMENGEYARALKHIEQTQEEYCTGKEIPLDLITKAGICNVHLGHKDKAEACFKVLEQVHAFDHPHLIIDVADSLVSVRHHDSALKYYMMIEDDSEKYNGYLHLKIARCYVSLKKDEEAIKYYKKAIKNLHDSIDARMMLSSLLLQKGRDDEAISVLSPPVESGHETKSDTRNLWQHSGKIKLKLSQIYKSKGSVEAFVDVLFPVIHETLLVEQNRQKFQRRRRLTRSVLSERTAVLNDDQPDRVLCGLRPFASSAAVSTKASGAKKVLQKKATLKEAKRAEALAVGFDYNSDDSDDESPQEPLESPLPEFLDEERNHLLIVDLCKSLSSLRRYSSALGIVKISLKLDTLSAETKMELRTIGAQLEATIADPAHGWDLVRDFVSRDL